MQDAITQALQSRNPIVIQADPGQTEMIAIAVNGLKAPSSPVTLTVNLAAGTYSGIIASPPHNVTLVINGTATTTTFAGHSPALTVLSGDVIVNNVILVNTTNATTILVKGGSLTLRHDTVQETTGGSQAAIAISGGTVDLGVTGDLGGNTLNVNGPGELIHNTGMNPVSALGDTFQVNGVDLRSPYRIEDKIFHALDARGGGLVTYVPRNVYVTPRSGSIQRAVNAVPAGFTIFIDARGHFDRYTVGSKPLTLAFQNGPTLQLAADSFLAPHSTTLRVTGSARDNAQIDFNQGEQRGTIAVAINGLPMGSFTPTGGIVAHGGGGKNAHIQVDDHVALTSMLFADGPNADLQGGGGATVEVGGGGSVTHLEGGRVLLIAGPGSAHVEIKSRRDAIVIGGSTRYDHNEAALRAIMAEWTRPISYASRVKHLSSGAGLNGTNVLNAANVHLNHMINHLQLGHARTLILGTFDDQRDHDKHDKTLRGS
jgi:hypothetical protein